jgi:uncharacterized repeat protein (TIGR03943 family)
MTTTTRVAPHHARERAPASHDAHTHSSPQGRAWLRVGAWLALCMLSLWVLLGGHADLYIAPNIRWMLWLASIVGAGIAALDGAAAWLRGDRPHLPIARIRRMLQHRPALASYVALFAPLALGVLTPPAVLGAGSILAHDGVVTLVGAPHGAPAAAKTLDFTLLQLRDRMQGAGLPSGTVVEVEGFVFHQPGLPANEWLLVRFITPHCVAEAQPLAVVAHASSRSPPDNAWVRITGTIVAGTADGQSAAIVDIQTLAKITQPLDPYLIY